MVAQSQVQHGGRGNVCLKKTPLKLPKPTETGPAELTQIAPRQQQGRKPSQSGLPVRLWSWCGQKEISCNTSWHWFASKSALCSKEDGAGDVPAGNGGCSVWSGAETPKEVRSLVEGPSNSNCRFVAGLRAPGGPRTLLSPAWLSELLSETCFEMPLSPSSSKGLVVCSYAWKGTNPTKSRENLLSSPTKVNSSQ